MRARRGFSLIELMVSMAVGMIVLLLAVSALRAVGEGYGRGTDGVAAEREARAVLTQAAEDLSKAVSGLEMVFEDSGSGWRRDRLGFFCLQPDDAQADSERVGDLCAVVYYVEDIEVGGELVRCLMRGFRGSQESFAALRSGDGSSLFEPDESDEPVSFGVIQFKVEPLVRQAVEGEGGEGSGEWVEWTPAEDPEEEAWEGPDAVRLGLVVARRELIAKLRDGGAWDSSPLLGDPERADESDQLELYEILQPFAHAS